jgi:hypothetical protein
METKEELPTVLNLTLDEIFTPLIMNIMPFFALDLTMESGRRWYMIQGCYGPIHFLLPLMDIFKLLRINCIGRHVIIKEKIFE